MCKLYLYLMWLHTVIWDAPIVGYKAESLLDAPLLNLLQASSLNYVLPLTDGIITLDSLQIMVKEKDMFIHYYLRLSARVGIPSRTL
ncbi:hypothetical protein ACS0TY_031784 [Phlomoides rotata]